MSSPTAGCKRTAAPRDRSLDVARAIAMLYIIVLWHLVGYTDAFSMVPYGGAYATAVFLGLFFVLSGYLLGSKYKLTDGAALRRYVHKRVLRIMPLYALALGSFVLLAYCTPRTALFAFLGLSSFVPPQPMTLWFVSMLLFFYVCFMVSGLRCKYVVWSAIYTLIVVASHGYDGIDPRLKLYFPCFVFGIILSRTGVTAAIARGGVLVFFLSAAILYLTEHTHPAVETFLTICLTISGSIAGLLLSRSLARIRGVGAFAGFVAYSSLAAYMFHRQIMHVFIYLYWPDGACGRLIYVLFFCAPAIVLAGYAGQKIYDRCLDSILAGRLRPARTCEPEPGDKRL